MMAFTFFFIYSSEANGNCLYSSVSILFSGNNSLSSHLRYLTCKELFLNLEFYYKHPLLSQAYNENKDLYTSYDNMFNFTVSTISFYTNARGVMLVREESKLNVKDNTSSPFLCIPVLSTVIQRSIITVYPDYGLIRYKKVFNNRQILPKVEDCGKPPFQILFCNMSKVPVGSHFLPNHYVPLENRKENKRGN